MRGNPASPCGEANQANQVFRAIARARRARRKRGLWRVVARLARVGVVIYLLPLLLVLGFDVPGLRKLAGL